MAAEDFLEEQLAKQRESREYELEPHEPHEDGAWRILRERRRQVEVEGWSPEHDDEHEDAGLLAAALCYVEEAFRKISNSGPQFDPLEAPPHWPWSVGYWKPSADPLRDLEKAGALIAAEIDRVERTRGN